jgi:hypothetical protein
VKHPSRAGRTGGSWYGSYQVVYSPAEGNLIRYDVTSRRHGERCCRQHVIGGALWAELIGTTAAVVYRKERATSKESDRG